RRRTRCRRWKPPSRRAPRASLVAPETERALPIFAPADLDAGGPVFQECPQAMAAAGVAQFAQRLGLDLADALARHGKVLSDFLEGVLASVVQAEPHLD